MTIKSKIFEYGNEHEADWPPRFVEKKAGFVGYWDADSMTFKEGYPPNPNNQFGTAPTVMFDSMPKTYHEAGGREVESRAEWQRLDKETNSLTFGNVNESRKYTEKGNKQQAKELKRDRRKASEEALKMVRANPKEIHEKCQKQAEKQHKTAKAIADNYGLHKQLKEIL